MVFDWFVFRVGRRRVLILLLFFGRRLSRRAHRPLQSTSRLVVTTPATHQNPPSPTRDRGNLVELPPTLFSRTTSLLLFLLPVKNSLNIETFWPRGIFETRISVQTKSDVYVGLRHLAVRIATWFISPSSSRKTRHFKIIKLPKDFFFFCGRE